MTNTTKTTDYFDIKSGWESCVLGQSNKRQAFERPEYQKMVDVYYTARYLMLMFECVEKKIPLQVWHECLKALDHFMRHLSSTDNEHQHLAKMEAHIKQSVVTVCKFLCLYYDDEYHNNIDKNSDAISSIDDGDFLLDCLQQHKQAKAELNKAQQTEARLTKDSASDDQLIALYCDAVFSYKKIADVYQLNLKQIAKAKSKYHKTHKTGTTLSIKQTAYACLASGLFCLAIGYYFFVL